MYTTYVQRQIWSYLASQHVLKIHLSSSVVSYVANIINDGVFLQLLIHKITLYHKGTLTGYIGPYVTFDFCFFIKKTNTIYGSII